ncbi:hypothetical protein BG000_008232 [Podila horticola]|nr:hypothetical protein BG000_008232 [Podila horticola]
MYEEDNIDIRDPWPRAPLSSYTSSPGFRHTSQLSRPVYYDRDTFQTGRYEQRQVAPHNDHPHTSASYREPYHPSDRHSRGDPPPKDHLGRNDLPSAPSYSHQPGIASARPSSAPSRPPSNYYPDTRIEVVGRDEGRSDLSQDSRHLQYNDRRHSQQQQHLPHHIQSQNQKHYDHYEYGPHNHNNCNTNHSDQHHSHQQPYDYASNIAPDILAHNHTTPSRPPFDHLADLARTESTFPAPVAPTNKGATYMSTPSATSTSAPVATSTQISASISTSMAATTPSKMASPSAALPVSLPIPRPPSASASEGRDGRDGRDGRERRDGREGPSHSDSASAQVLSDYAQPDPGNADTRARDRAYENSPLTAEGTYHPYHAPSSTSSSSLSPAHDDPVHQRPPSQQWCHQGTVSVSVSKRDSHDDEDERHYSIDPRWNDPKYHAYRSASASGYLKSYSPSTTTTHTHTRLQNHHVWDGAELNGSTAHLPSPSTSSSSVYTPPLSYHGPSYTRSSQPSSSQAHSQTQPPRTHSIPHPEDQSRQELNLQEDPNFESNDEDEDDESWQSAKNLGFKFGTDMPTTIDLKAAIDSCDTLCKFALHYARQSQDYHPQGYPGPGSLLLEEHERTTLQAIRSMSSAMLLGFRMNKECDKEGKDDKEVKDKETKEGGDDPSKSSPSEPVFNPENSIKFGTGAPSDKMVHELAKAATSIFQLAIRIKAWVNMTPEERELDEEINIIRGKRCLVMDGSSSLPPLDQFSHPQMDWAMLQAKSTFHTPMEKRVHHHQESISRGMDSMDIDRQFGGGGEGGHDGHVSFASGGSGSKAKSKAVIKAGSSSKDESAAHQKYRKRAKRTHPPGRCMSCDSSDTPEWRRGPDGARTLCNACGLHYAKLLKRQNKEHKTKQDLQLQFISFPFRKRAKSLSPEKHRDGSKESDTMPAENNHSLEQEQHPQQDMPIEPGQQQQQHQSSSLGQGSAASPSIETSEYVPTIAPVSAS